MTDPAADPDDAEMSDQTADISPTSLPVQGDPIEYMISLDIAKKGLVIAPVIVAICALIWGSEGAAGAAVGIGLVVANFLLSAALVSGAARISLGLMMGAVLFGYALRLGLIFLVIVLVRDEPWISLPALGATIIATHLGLLMWELRYVAINLAYPGLAPKQTKSKPRLRHRRHTTPARTPHDFHSTGSHKEQIGNNVLALEFPPLNEILRWRDLFPTFNKVALIAVAAALIGIVIFLIAASKDGSKAPKGIRNFAELLVEFVENQIIMPAMGKSGMGWTPFLLTLFIFIYLCNLPGIIPILYMPATARMAIPLFLALLVWLVYVGTGLKHQGLGYFGHMIAPPGVPAALYPLIGPIEILSNLVIRPFSLAVRLFANMLAGHILLVTFSLLTEELILEGDNIIFRVLGVLPFIMLMLMTVFEVLVGFLQAYIFTILTAVYIGSSAHPEH
ncbi:MAG: F0F1 ATP synthase subunit A [Ilumatobacter fluminis]